MINNRKMKTKLDLLQPPVNRTVSRNLTMEKQFNAAHGARWKEFVVGDLVYYRQHESNTKWKWEPAVVKQRIGEVNYTIQLGSGRIVKKAHSNQLKFRHNKNEIIEEFDLIDITETEIEPTITTQPLGQDVEQDDHDISDIYEDAQEDSEIEQQVELRRTTRSNAGVPPNRYGFDD